MDDELVPAAQSESTRRCIDCGTTFYIAPLEREFYLKKDMVLPKRCAACRAARRKERPWWHGF